jgi:hypothetical protein
MPPVTITFLLGMRALKYSMLGAIAFCAGPNVLIMSKITNG